jgi:hypothetical protein
MPIFYTDTGSLSRLEVSGSVLISGSGKSILSISGSSGGLLEVSDLTAGANVFQITSASIDIFTIHSNKKVVITGSLIATEGITGSLSGTSSFALTASFALNAGGGGSGAGFPFAGTAVITGSIVLTSGSGFPSLLASETLTAGDLVNIFSGGVRRASNDDLTKQAHGFVTQSRAATNPVVVFYSGLNTNVTGLTAGARYFLSTAGSEATTPPTATARLSQEVGVAVSTTALLVNFGPAIIT